MEFMISDFIEHAYRLARRGSENLRPEASTP